MMDPEAVGRARLLAGPSLVDVPVSRMPGGFSSRFVAAAAVLALPASLFAVAPPATSLDTILGRAGEHVRRFQHDFTLVISDEDYRQHANGLAYIGPLHRRTVAEMLFLWLPDEAVWLTVRSVRSADGRDVPGSPNRLDDALHEQGAERLTRLRRIVNDNAKFNVGRAFRNFNYPTLVLSFLAPDQQPRFRFTLAGRERVRGAIAWKVNYEEHTTPTSIQGDGADRVSRGAVWIREGDAAVAASCRRHNRAPVWSVPFAFGCSGRS